MDAGRASSEFQQPPQRQQPPDSVVVVSFDHKLYVSDTGNHLIRRVLTRDHTQSLMGRTVLTPATTVSTIAGSGISGYADGMGTAAMFSYPLGWFHFSS